MFVVVYFTIMDFMFFVYFGVEYVDILCESERNNCLVIKAMLCWKIKTDTKQWHGKNIYANQKVTKSP